MLPASLSQIGTDQLEALKYFWLIPLYVASTVGVLVGVYLEKDEFNEPTKHFGWRLLVWSLFAEIFFGMLIFIADATVSNIQRDQIIALQTRLAPRTLTEAQQSLIIQFAKKFPGVRFDFSIFAPDAVVFFHQLSDALTNGGWVRVSWTLDAGGWFYPTDGVTVGNVPLTGIEIAASDPKLNGAMTELIGALRATGNKDTDPRFLDPAKEPPGSAHVLHIMIGQKR